jgi:ferredoxin-NADP reductase
MPALDRLAAALPWLTVVPALSDDPWHPAARGTVVEVALRYANWQDRDVYVCGSPDMVAGTVDRLRQAGVAEARIHVEDFGAAPVQREEVTTW